MRGEMDVLKTPPAASPYKVRKPPERRTTTARPHKWHVAARLGPQARVDETNYRQTAADPPPAMRRPSLREALHFLHAPLRIGVSASMNADASLSFSGAGHRYSCTVLELRGRQTEILLRMEGASSRDSEAPRGNPTLRRKVGFRFCCARATQIATPIIYAAGADDWL